MSGNQRKISIIIPVFNESARIDQGLIVIANWHGKFPEWEFILINDGSSDDTKKKIQKYKFIKLISYSENQGKGFALKQGVAGATKPFILLSDIDFSTPLTELPKLLKKINKDNFVIGSRKTDGAKILKHQSFWREWLGKQFTNLAKVFLGLKVSDVTCGFKLMSNKVGKKLFRLSSIKRWGYDAEILFIAKLNKIKVVEVPVVWKNDELTKVNILRDIFQSIKELGLIRINQWLRKYRD